MGTTFTVTGNVQIVGGKELEAALYALEPAIMRSVERKGLREAANMVKVRAKQLCPVSDEITYQTMIGRITGLGKKAAKIRAGMMWRGAQGRLAKYGFYPGYLRDSIKVQAGKRKKHFINIVVGILKESNAFYAHFVEGDYNMKRNYRHTPFMRPAFDSQREALVNRFITSISDALSKVWSGGSHYTD